MRRKTLVPAKRTENPPHRSALKSGNSSSWSGKGNELSGGQVVALAVISEPVCSPGIASILLLHGVLGPLLQGLLSGCRVRASPRGGFSCSRARAPGHTGLRSCSSGF